LLDPLWDLDKFLGLRQMINFINTAGVRGDWCGVKNVRPAGLIRGNLISATAGLRGDWGGVKKWF
jgi:hypothetical protein